MNRKPWKSKRRPSYAYISRTVLGSKRVRSMSGLGLRVLFYAHAAWRGRPPLLLLTTSTTGVPARLGMERVRFARGCAEVVATGLLVKTRSHIRPGGAGFRAPDAQRAAEWDLPAAHHGAVVPLDHGDERLPGAWRLLSSNLEKLVAVARGKNGELRPLLTDDQLRVLVALAQGPRDKYGALQDPEKRQVTAQTVVDRLPRLTLRTAQRALAAMEPLGLVRKAAGGTGRAPAIYEPAGLLVRGLPWSR